MTTPADDTAGDVERAQAQLDAAKAAHLAAQKDRPPREPAIVLGDLLAHIVSRFGNHPDLEALLAEYRATLPKEEPAPEDQPTK